MQSAFAGLLHGAEMGCVWAASRQTIRNMLLACAGPRRRTTSEQDERSKAAAQAHIIQVTIATCPVVFLPFLLTPAD